MSMYRKVADLYRKVRDTIFPKAPDLKIPVRYLDLPDPKLPPPPKKHAEQWPFTNRYRALRKRRNKLASRSRKTNQAKARL